MYKCIYLLILTLATVINPSLSFAQSKDSILISSDTLLSEKIADTINLPKLYVSENTIISIGKSTHIKIVHVKNTELATERPKIQQKETIQRVEVPKKNPSIAKVLEKKISKKLTSEKKKIFDHSRPQHLAYNSLKKSSSTVTNTTSHVQKFIANDTFQAYRRTDFECKVKKLYYSQYYLRKSTLYTFKLTARPPPVLNIYFG